MSNPPFTVRSVFEYASGHDDDLSFPIGQIVTVTALEDDDWYYGEYSDAHGTKREGIFPQNFVERYEPPAPPRPSRPRPKKEPEPAPVESPVVESKQPEPEPEFVPEVQPAEEEHDIAPPQPPMPQSPPLPASVPVAEAVHSPPQPVKAPAPAPASPVASTEPAAKTLSKPAPPAVAEKPSGSSFRDRIAAFNKPAAAPVTPFKPGGSQPSFIKKPFVAPPPSRDAYKPPPREPAPKVYKREEDPDVKEQIAREPPVSESRPAPREGGEEDADEQPKPTSLKERIALLQKQQLEQAQRHAEAAQKKEKPARPPPKKATEETVAPAALEEEQEVSPSVEGPGTARDPSVDTLRTAVAPPQPSVPFSPTQEIASDANDADYSAAADSEDTGETSTSKDDEDEQSQSRPASRRQPSTRTVEQTAEPDVKDESDAEEEEEMDPETKRRMELRERMAKMSGGMGMMGLFGPPGGGMPGMPGAGTRKPPAKTQAESEKRLGELEAEANVVANAPPVPLPGMNMASKPVPPPHEVEKEEEERPATPLTEQHSAREVPDVEEVVHEGAMPRSSFDRPVTASQPQEFSAPPPPSRESRPAPPVLGSPPASPLPVRDDRSFHHPSRPTTATTADRGDESDDELSVYTSSLSLNNPVVPPVVPAPAIPDQVDSRRSSTYDPVSSTASTPAAEKRTSRLPPPIPTNPPMPPPSQGRAPPPPPPDQLRRRSTVDSRIIALPHPRQAGEEAEGEVTEYDGDYDTDIASGVKHKDALRSHERDSSFDEGTTTDDYSIQSPRSPQGARHPPPPPPTAPRAVPPPPPSQPPRNARASIDTPRGPPPPPPNREPAGGDDEDDEYDPFNYSAPHHGLPTSPTFPPGRPEAPPPFPPQKAVDEYDDLYDAPPVRTPVTERPPAFHERRPSLAPPVPQSHAPSLPSPSVGRSQRASMDLLRSQPNVRRSMDVSRPSIDQGFIATDIDFAEHTLWWTKPNTPPPVFQNRSDLLFEVEETKSTKRGGKTTVSKDVYVMFIDYSQTVLNVQFDPKNPVDASFEQRHEPPPLQPRQDQLEQAHIQLGTRISEAVNSVQNSTVGDGTPFGLVQYLLNPLSQALLPVGTRGYGASVYSNLANASVSQNDEIRAGDIVSFRNARFQGHRGTMHQKYSAEVGKPDHVGIVVDWDGTKKKIRAWEQGRESKKVKMESFKLNDLRSGECKVWRVMPRSWVGWEASK